VQAAVSASLISIKPRLISQIQNLLHPSMAALQNAALKKVIMCSPANNSRHWLAMNYEGERKIGGLLDLTNPEAAKWME